MCVHHGADFRLRSAALNGDLSFLFTNEAPSLPQREGLTEKEFKLLWKRLRGGFLLSELKKMEIDENTPVFVSYNRNGEAAFNYEHEGNQQIFSKGACGYFAYALHERTKLPLVVFTENPDNSYWEGHVAVKLGDDKFLDVTGVCSVADYERRYGLHAGKYTVENMCSVEQFKSRMSLPESGSVYATLNDLEKAILFRCADDVVKDFVL